MAHTRNPSLLTNRLARSIARSVIPLLLLATSSAFAVNLPALPLAIDSTYAAPSGQVINVPAGGNFQAALNNAQLGDTIVLQAGATYTGPFTLPNKTTGNGWIYIRSSNYAQLPAPGQRVSISDAANMPKIVANGADGGVLFTAAGAHHYRFVGIEMSPATGKYVYAVVSLGNDDTSLAAIAHHFVFDRCYIHGDPVVGSRRGFAANAASVALVDSYVSDFKEAGGDTQAFWALSSPGPFKIVNNYLEAAGENIMFGGGTPKGVDFIPADIEIRDNLLTKPLSWLGSAWQVKNLLEFKMGIRALITNNHFLDNWAQNQQGFALVITPRNEYNVFPQAVVKDITIVGNRFTNVSQGITIAGIDDGDNVPGRTSQRTYRVLIRDNILDVTLIAAVGNSDGRLFAISGGPVDVTIDHNTGFVANKANSSTLVAIDTIPIDRFTLTNNIVSNATYSWWGPLASIPKDMFAAHFTNSVATNNAIINIAYGGYNASQFPAGNFFPATNTAVGFVDFAGGNFQLRADSPYAKAGLDGKDLGANTGVVPAALAARATPSPPPSVAVR